MKLLSLILIMLLLTGCAGKEPDAQPENTDSPEPTVTSAATLPTETEAPDPIDPLLSAMTTEEKVGQLFLARCNAATALEDIEKYHLGGFVLFGVDFESRTPDSLFNTIASYQFTADIPLLIAVDEEGGTVTRASRYPAFRKSPFPSPRNLFDQGGMELVLETEAKKSTFLRGLGINVNLGPVCDITTNPAAFMYQRSLGQDAETTARFVGGMVKTMSEYRVGSVLKHFPGYGNNTDTHTGIAVDGRSLSELEENDLIPFAAGIEAGCGGIMVSHTFVEYLDTEYPASLSPAVHQYLREQMGFAGVIMTDDLVMQAITDQYGAGEAAVLAVLAGNDLLCSSEYAVQYAAVLAAVQDGRISTDILDCAVRNVLEWKAELGLIS